MTGRQGTARAQALAECSSHFDLSVFCLQRRCELRGDEGPGCPVRCYLPARGAGSPCLISPSLGPPFCKMKPPFAVTLCDSLPRPSGTFLFSTFNASVTGTFHIRRKTGKKTELSFCFSLPVFTSSFRRLLSLPPVVSYLLPVEYSFLSAAQCRKQRCSHEVLLSVTASVFTK